jgi:hypothetical protein
MKMVVVGFSQGVPMGISTEHKGMRTEGKWGPKREEEEVDRES